MTFIMDLLFHKASEIVRPPSLLARRIKRFPPVLVKRVDLGGHATFQESRKAGMVSAQQFESSGTIADLTQMVLNRAQLRQPTIQSGAVARPEQLEGVAEAFALQPKTVESARRRLLR